MMKASPKLKSLRTLILMSGNGVILDGFFYNHKLLRVLDLSSNGIDELPDSIELLNHLRYLDLSEGRMQKLPEQLTKLFGLQTLKLRNFFRLRKLPVNFSKLINLRHLDLDVKRQLNLMPLHFGRLVYLQELSAFIVRRGKGYGLEQLKCIKYLRGTLRITNLEDVSEGKVLEGTLDVKAGLQKLHLEWSSSMVMSFQSRTVVDLAERVLSGLKPHENVKELEILNYCGRMFPSWLYDPLTKLTSMCLKSCSCSILQPLGQLQFLRFLSIENMPHLTTISDLFCCSGSTNGGFPSLKSLKFINMQNLTDWDGLTHSMPILSELKIISCPVLQRVPPFVHLSSLQTLEFVRCPQLPSLPELPGSLTSLVIVECPIIGERCNVDEGEDYHRVRHLQRLEIDYVEVNIQH